MGREKIKIKKIDNISARQVTFSKRRQGLMKKASELAILCEAEVAVVIFSTAGRLYQYSNTDIKDTINKFFLHLDSRQHSVGFQGENKNNSNSHRGVQDKINDLRHIRSEYLQHFKTEELVQLETKLDGILKYVKEKKKELCMDDVPALHTKDIQTTDTIRTQSGESSYSVQETIGTIPKINPQGDCFVYPRERTAQSGATNYLDRWIPPPPDVYKVNFAGVNFHDANVSGVGVGVGVGVVVRNWRGEFMAALTRFFPELMDMNTTFWMAAKCATEFAVDYYFTHIVLEGDAPNSIKGLQNTYEDHSQTSTNIMQEAEGHMRQLGSCSLSHVQTSGNIAAHMVAQYARNVGDEHVWLMKEPDFLGDILLADIGQLNY